jgi:hypothetical protein
MIRKTDKFIISGSESIHNSSGSSMGNLRPLIGFLVGQERPNEPEAYKLAFKRATLVVVDGETLWDAKKDIQYEKYNKTIEDKEVELDSSEWQENCKEHFKSVKARFESFPQLEGIESINCQKQLNGLIHRDMMIYVRDFLHENYCVDGERYHFNFNLPPEDPDSKYELTRVGDEFVAYLYTKGFTLWRDEGNRLFGLDGDGKLVQQDEMAGDGNTPPIYTIELEVRISLNGYPGKRPRAELTLSVSSEFPQFKYVGDAWAPEIFQLQNVDLKEGNGTVGKEYLDHTYTQLGIEVQRIISGDFMEDHATLLSSLLKLFNLGLQNALLDAGFAGDDKSMTLRALAMAALEKNHMFSDLLTMAKERLKWIFQSLDQERQQSLLFIFTNDLVIGFRAAARALEDRPQDFWGEDSPIVDENFICRASRVTYSAIDQIHMAMFEALDLTEPGTAVSSTTSKGGSPKPGAALQVERGNTQDKSVSGAMVVLHQKRANILRHVIGKLREKQQTGPNVQTVALDEQGPDVQIGDRDPYKLLPANVTVAVAYKAYLRDLCENKIRFRANPFKDQLVGITHLFLEPKNQASTDWKSVSTPSRPKEKGKLKVETDEISVSDRSSASSSPVLLKRLALKEEYSKLNFKAGMYLGVIISKHNRQKVSEDFYSALVHLINIAMQYRLLEKGFSMAGSSGSRVVMKSLVGEALKRGKTFDDLVEMSREYLRRVMLRIEEVDIAAFYAALHSSEMLNARVGSSYIHDNPQSFILRFTKDVDQVELKEDELKRTTFVFCTAVDTGCLVSREVLRERGLGASGFKDPKPINNLSGVSEKFLNYLYAMLSKRVAESPFRNYFVNLDRVALTKIDDPDMRVRLVNDDVLRVNGDAILPDVQSSYYVLNMGRPQFRQRLRFLRNTENISALLTRKPFVMAAITGLPYHYGILQILTLYPDARMAFRPYGIIVEFGMGLVGAAQGVIAILKPNREANVAERILEGQRRGIITGVFTLGITIGIYLKIYPDMNNVSNELFWSQLAPVALLTMLENGFWNSFSRQQREKWFSQRLWLEKVIDSITKTLFYAGIFNISYLRIFRDPTPYQALSAIPAIAFALGDRSRFRQTIDVSMKYLIAINFLYALAADMLTGEMSPAFNYSRVAFWSLLFIASSIFVGKHAVNFVNEWEDPEMIIGRVRPGQWDPEAADRTVVHGSDLLRIRDGRNDNPTERDRLLTLAYNSHRASSRANSSRVSTPEAGSRVDRDSSETSARSLQEKNTDRFRCPPGKRS